MKVAVYSTHKFEKEYLIKANNEKHNLLFIEVQLSLATIALAQGCKAISIFVNDDASQNVLEKLEETGIKYISLRSAGYNNVDLKAAANLGMKVVRVPEYSPYAVAEFTVAIMLALNRKLIQAHNRVRELNFSLDGLAGFDMNNKIVGLIGLGRIGSLVAKILHGFGCQLLAYDTVVDKELAERYNIRYTDITNICKKADIISLHVPLTDTTKYIINKERVVIMKKGVMLINTGRGSLINTRDVIYGLKTGQIGYLGLDVYEEEKALFFEDHSEDILQDDVIARLMTFQNVIITSHQAFLTDTALKNIAETTMHNLDSLENNTKCENELHQT